ncbi:MAG: YfcE family phosphodiesterase [Desulfotomaculales bacterium]
MRVGLVSDTHGELENLREALRQMTDRHAVEMVVHLGDEWEDAAVFRELPPAVEVLAVPGIYAPEYRNPAVLNRVVREIAGWRVLFTHASSATASDLPGDPDPEELAAGHAVDVVAYGHTHVPSAEERGGVLWVNPGHLKSADKKGHPPGYAVLTFREEEVKAEVFDLRSGEPFLEAVFTKRKITLYAPGVSIRGLLNDTATAQRIWAALPCGGKASLWGEELYFRVPVAADLENGQETVQPGDIGYWPPGQAVCFFFGATPVSAGGEIRPYSPVTVVGRLLDDPRELKQVEDKAPVKIERNWP